MKLLYVAFAGTDQSGVHRKLAEQINAMRASGADVESLVFGDSRVAPSPAAAPYRFVDLPGGGFDAASRATAFAVCAAAVHASAPDIVYMRYPVYDAHVLEFVRLSVPVVFEIQSIYANEAPPALAALEQRWAEQILPHAAGIVAVTSEILDYEMSRANGAVPGHVMPNGADPATIPFVTPQLATGRVDLSCVASFYPWHGVDRLIVGFAAEPDVQDVHLHLIGDGPTVPALRTLAREAHVNDRVHFHGRVPSSALEPWYAHTHVAIGSMAPHRVGLRELAALKHREYVLRGLPMVFAGGDADFSRMPPWARCLPADDSPVSPRMLRVLALNWAPEARRRQIRQWGESHVSWNVKIPPLLEFLASCRARHQSAVA